MVRSRAGQRKKFELNLRHLCKFCELLFYEINNFANDSRLNILLRKPDFRSNSKVVFSKKISFAIHFLKIFFLKQSLRNDS